MPPRTRCAKSGDVHVAYQVAGDGPLDVVLVPGFATHVEALWGPLWGPFVESLASFCRLILFDERGTGMSDRTTEVGTLEERMEDVRAVMDAAGSERAAGSGLRFAARGEQELEGVPDRWSIYAVED